MTHTHFSTRSRGVSLSRPSGARRSKTLATTAAAVVSLAILVPAQTRFKLDGNKYTLEQDVKVGQEAAAQVSKEMPLLNDARTEEWVEQVGRDLVAAIPAEFSHPPFRYTFDVINQKEINAVALPGGPMFLNRGMIEAGMTEAEVTGVMGHEIAHVALRHGTAQATKSEKFQLGALAGQVLGAVIGGTTGSLIAQGSQFGVGTYFLKYGRGYERQADLLGAQILARAGYDPRQMANMFKTIESQSGGSRDPEWMSSHPNPGNRYDAIMREAALLTVQGSADSGQFNAIKSRLAGMSPAPTAEQIAKGNASKSKFTGGATPSGGARTAVRVEPPSNQGRTYRPANFLTVTVPANWRSSSASENIVTYAPAGGAGDNGFTHGLQVGVLQSGSGNLQRDTEQMVQSFARSHPSLRLQEGFKRDTLGGRAAYTGVFSNISDATGGAEEVTISTTQLRGSNVLFLIGVAPQSEASTYTNTFMRVRQTLQISD